MRTLMLTGVALMVTACAPQAAEVWAPTADEVAAAHVYSQTQPLPVLDAVLDALGEDASSIDGYTAHQLQFPKQQFVVVNGIERSDQGPGDVAVFYKDGTDPERAVSYARAGTASFCRIARNCSGVIKRSPTAYSLRELRSFETWLRSSPLGRYSRTRFENVELVNDGEPTVLRLIVEVPEANIDDAVQMFERVGAGSDAVLVVRLRPYMAD